MPGFERRSRLPATVLVAALLFTAAGISQAATAAAVLRIREQAAVELRFSESLRVLETPVAPGAPVSSGQDLLTLDTRPLYRELEQKQASSACFCSSSR